MRGDGAAGKKWGRSRKRNLTVPEESRHAAQGVALCAYSGILKGTPEIT